MPTGAGFGGYGFMHEFPVADEPGRKRLRCSAVFADQAPENLPALDSGGDVYGAAGLA
jgi:hypothetical protein